MGLALPGNNSLKGKRSVVRKILDRSRSRFNVAAAETGDLDNHRRITLGFAVISNDSRHANSMLDKVASFVTGATEAVVMSQRLEIIPIDEEFGRDGAGLELESFKLDDGSDE
jgi:uncharacterized protein YlxP (DUF503 family)